MRALTTTPSRSRHAGGFVLLAVLFVLLALFALTAPFLATARNADAESQFLADDVQLRLGLDGAGRHARYELGGTHPALDVTPYFDSEEELRVDTEFPDTFPAATGEFGAAWDAEARDVTGLIDLGSAPPQVLANVLSSVARLTQPATPDENQLNVTRPDLFDPGGVVFIDGELVQLAPPREDDGDRRTTASLLVAAQRGLETSRDSEGNVVTTGPLPPRNHGVGSYVFDQRTFAPALWRTLSLDGELQGLDAIDELRATEPFSLSGGFSADDMRVLRRTTSPYGGIGAGPQWQRPTRLTAPLAQGESYTLRVREGRWMAPGSTIRITNGITTDLRVITSRGRDGRVFIDRVVDNDYDAVQTQVSVLAKRPVNVNTAPLEVLVALFANLRLANQNHRIDDSEAAAIASVVVQSRPILGFEDFMRRVVLPAGGVDVLPGNAPVLPLEFEAGGRVFDDARDAAALYINALNANDARLAFATMPLCYTTRGVFDLELRANVAAPSGIERTSGVRERTELVVPQRPDLFVLFIRQRDFDEALRLERGAPYWLTGPEPTGRYDSGVTPPSRLVPNLGTHNGSRYIPGIDEPIVDADGNPVAADRVFATEDEAVSFVQLDPIRLLPNARTQGRIHHFDQESRSLEGRFLPDQAVLVDAAGGIARWADAGTGVMQPLSLSMWVKPEVGGDGTFMSVGNRTGTSDRIVLGTSGDSLVLRVYDGMGDHRDTTFEEYAEVRFPIASGPGVPGLPTEVWSHVDLDVRGNRPDQMGLLVNGFSTGVEKLGMTRLTGGLASGSGVISVESTEGFPTECVLRIGNELVEATVSGPNTFDVTHLDSGASAGFGGRLARVRYDIEGADEAAPTAFFAAAVTGAYAAGTPVVHYGYSLPLTDNVPSGGMGLAGDLGIFRVGRAIGLPNDTSLEPIVTAGSGINTITLGRGWTSQTLGDLKLGSADAFERDPEGAQVMAGFNPNGGYALLSGIPIGNVDGLPVNPLNGDQVGGWEVVRYSRVTGNAITVVERGVQFQRFADSTDPGTGGTGGGGLGATGVGVAKSFVFDWNVGFAVTQSVIVPGNEYLPASTFCFPISISVPGATTLSYSEPNAVQSQFAQITRTDDAEATEWVRYDEVDLRASQLVRCAPGALSRAHVLLHSGGRDIQTGNGPGGGGPGGGGGGGGGGNRVAPDPPVDPEPAAASLVPSASRRVAGSDWDPVRGADPNDEFPLSRAVASELHFRGVLGTHIGEHPAGTIVVPAFPITVSDGDFERGRPGARDPVFVVDGSLSALGIPVTVHRAHYPAEQRRRHTYTFPPEGGLTTAPGPAGDFPQGGFRIGSTAYVAMETAVLIPTSPGGGNVGSGNITDPRFRGRLVKFPSGELPRSAGAAAIGVGANGQVDFGVANCTVDEIVWGNSETFGGLSGSLPAAHAAGAPLILSQSVGPTDLSLSVFPSSVKAADGTIGNPAPLLTRLPADGGLLRIGEEIVAYRSYQAGDGTITLSAAGRGLLGTRPQPHEITEPVHWLESWEVTTLAGPIGPDDAAIPVVDVQNFPVEGTLLVGGELIHYTSLFGGALTMPRSSAEAGEQDGLGPGVYRGRYGTTPGSHAAGTAVILFPARYWDRYAPRFDGPELGYFGLHVAQPAAWFAGVTWESEEASLGGVEVVVLQRAGDVAWDADPETEPRLTLQEDGTFEDGLIPINLQADLIEWRVFARYVAGAFDPQFGLQHGWKQTPRFRHLGVSYSAPGRILRSIDR